MNIEKEAIENHEDIFEGVKYAKDDTKPLSSTDPEYLEIFLNFAFGDVFKDTNLDNKTRMMVILASMIAQNTVPRYKVFLKAALGIGLTPVEAKEIVYQAIPYVGIARVFDLIYATNEVLAESGYNLPLEGQSTTSRDNRFEEGLKLQKSIFGDTIDKMRENAPSDQKHIQDYLSANCFGDFYTRSGLDIKTRELLTFSMLVSLGGCEAQVKGHIQGNLNVGNDRKVLVDTVTNLLPYIGYPRSLNAFSCINEICK